MAANTLLFISVFALLILMKLYRRPRRVRQRLCTSVTGAMYVKELLDGASTNVYDLLRMDKESFVRLCDVFKDKGWLGYNKYLDVEEKMAIFLMTISHNCTNSFVKARFQHSGETISKYFHEVLDAMMKFAKEVIVPSSFDDENVEIHSYHRLRTGPFKGAIGAIDGTLINASVAADKQVLYRSRGGKDCFQNVMGVCDFNMKFVYVMAGWEGVAHDSKVLHETLRHPEHNFPIPPEGKYYLCDAAYIHTRGFMCPYRGVRCRLPDFRRAGVGRGKEERFNHAHAQLRNVIERTFGVLKARFKILYKMPPYSFKTQVRIVVACMAIHNFLRSVTLDDELFREYETDDVELPRRPAMDSEERETPPYHGIFSDVAQEEMVNLRDAIASEMLIGNY